MAGTRVLAELTTDEYHVTMSSIVLVSKRLQKRIWKTKEIPERQADRAYAKHRDDTDKLWRNC